jgi:hypothetical protein
MVRLFVNDEFERMWKEVVYFKVLSHHLPVGTEEKPLDSWSQFRFELRLI